MLMLCLICIYSVISIASARPEPQLIKRQNIPEADAPPNPGYEPPRYAPLGDSSLTSSTYNVNSFTSAANFGNPMQEGLTTTLLPKKWFSFENYQPSKNKNFTESKPSDSKTETEYHFDESADRDENLLNTAQIEGLLDVVKRRNNKRPMLFEPVFSTSTAKSLLPANGEHFLDSMRYSMSVPAETVTSFDEMTNAGDFAHSIGRKSVKQPIKRATIAAPGSVAERLEKSNKGPRYVGDVNDANFEYSEVEENGAKSEAPREIFDVTKPPLSENIDMSRKQEGDQNGNSQMAQLILSPSTAATYEANAEYLTSLAAILTRRHRGSKNVEGNKAFFGLNNPEFKGIVAETTSPSTKKPSILNFIHKFIEIRQETTDTLYPVAVAENATETSLPRMKRGHFRKHNNSLKPPSKDGKETGCATLCVQPKKKGKRKFNKKSKRRSLFKKFDFHRKRNKEKKKQRRQAYEYTNMDMSMLPSNYLMQTNQPGNNQWQYNMPNANDLKAQIPNITESRELNSPAFNLDDKALKSFDSASPGLQQTAQPTLKFGMPDASQLNPELTNYNPAEPSQNMDQSNPLSTDMDQSNPLLPNKEQQNQYPQFDQSGPNQSPNFDQPNQNPSPSEQLSQNQFEQPNQNPSPNFEMPEAEQPIQNQSPHYDRTNPNQMPRYENPNQLPHFEQPVQNESPFFGKHKQQSHVNQPKQNIPHIDIPQSNEVLPQNAESPHFNKHKMKGKANSNKKTAKMSSTTIKGNKAVYTLKSHRPSTTLRSWFFEHGLNMYKVEPGSKERSYDESLPVSTANPKTKKRVTQTDNPTYTFPKMNPYNKLFANPQAEQKPMNLRDLDGMNNDLRHDISKLMKVVTDFHDYSNVQDPGKRIGARSQVNFVTEKSDRTIKPRHGNMQKYKHAKEIYRPTHKSIVKLSENSRFQSGKNKEKSDLYYNNNNANFAHVTPNAFIDRKLVSVTTPRFNDDSFKSRHESAQRENSNYRYNNILNAEKEAEKPAAKAAEKPADKPPEAKPKSKPSKVKISNHVYKFDIIYSKLHERPGGNDNNGPDYYDSATETVDFAPNNMERPSHRNDQSGRQRRRSRRKRFMKNDVFKKLWPKKHDRVFEVAEATATVASRVSGHRPGTTLLTPVAFSAYSKGFGDSPSTTIFLKSKLTEHVKTPEEALEEAPVTMTKPEATNKFTEHFSSATKTLNDKIDNSNANNFKQPNNVTQKTYNDSIANEEFNTDSQTIDNIEKVLLQKSSNLRNDLKFSFLQKDMTDFHDMFKLIEKKSQKNIIKRNAEAKQTAPGLTSKSDNYNHSTTEQNQMSSEIETTTVNNDNKLNKNLSGVMTISPEIENVTSKTPNAKRNTVTIISTENETVPLDVVNNLSPVNLADNNSDDLSFPEPYILLKVPKDAVTSTQAVDAKSEKRGIYIPIDQLMQITESTTPMSPSQPKPNPNIIDGLYMISQNNGKFILRPLLDLSGSLNVKTLSTSLTNQRALPEKIVMSSEFLASIQNKLSRIYDTLSSKQGPAQWASFRQSKDGRRGKRTLNKFPQLCKSSGCLKCRANHTMCKACAATDAVISELIFEFNNLAYFIKNHCNELQLFFAMNPTGGKKLKESVHRVDQLIVRFYKRAKTEESKDCNKFPPGIDKRSVSNVARILDKCTKKTDPNYPRVKLETIGTRNGTNKKVVKNVYSMDNIKVNIICDPVPVTQAHYDYDLATLDILIHSHDMEKLVHKKKKSRFHKLMQKIFHKSDRREIQARANSTSRAVSKRSLDNQMVNNVEPNIITDTGGDFWVQYLKKPGFESPSNEDLDFARQQRSPTQGYTQAMQTDDYIETNEITLKEEEYATVKPFVSADFPMDETEILTKDLDETELHKPQKNTSKKHKIKNKIFFDEYLSLNPHLKNFKEQNDMWQAFPVNSESFVVQDQSTAKPNDTKPEEPEKDLVVVKTVTSNTRDFNATTAQALQQKINLLLDKIHSVTTDLLNQSINFEDIYRVAENQTTKEKYKSSPSVVIVDDDKARKDHYRTKYDGQENTIESRKMSNVIESKPVYYNIVTRKMQKPATFTKVHTLSARHEHKTHTKTTKRIMSQSNEQRTHESQMVIMKRVHNMLVDRKSTSYVQSTSKPPPKTNKQSKWYIGSF